ncbi:MAG: TIGR04150 pseudo-rSAM protein [Bacteroidota bacterium]
MSNPEFYWLMLEPYVHGIVVRNDVLLYNTETKTYLTSRGVAEVAQLASTLLDPANGYVVMLPKKDINLPSVRKFTDDLRRKYMGDLLDPQWSSTKPFNIVPKPIVKQGVKGIENHLIEITFHLGTCNDRSIETYKEASRLFHFPVYAETSGPGMPLGILDSIAAQMETLPYATINLIVCTLPGDAMLVHLRSLFNRKPFRRKIHIPLTLTDLPPGFKLEKNEYLTVYVTFPADQRLVDRLHAVAGHLQSNPRLEFVFVVQDDQEAELATEMIKTLACRNISFKPYLNGNNIQFFREQVYISEDEIKGSKPTQNQVFSRMVMNENDFGKLVILPDGSVYANLNNASLGNAADHTLEDLVSEELNHGSSWKRTRPSVEPCKNCLYQFLCPPISNYELFSRKFNFCHINP